MFEVLHMLVVVFRSDVLSAGPACSVEAEVWAGNVYKPLRTIKDLWVFCAPPRTPSTSFAGELSAKWLHVKQHGWEVLLCGEDVCTLPTAFYS